MLLFHQPGEIKAGLKRLKAKIGKTSRQSAVSLSNLSNLSRQPELNCLSYAFTSA